MFELSSRLIGIYKVANQTRSVAIGEDMVPFAVLPQIADRVTSTRRQQRLVSSGHRGWSLTFLHCLLSWSSIEHTSTHDGCTAPGSLVLSVLYQSRLSRRFDRKIPTSFFYRPLLSRSGEAVEIPIGPAIPCASVDVNAPSYWTQFDTGTSYESTENPAPSWKEVWIDHRRPRNIQEDQHAK